MFALNVTIRSLAAYSCITSMKYFDLYSLKSSEIYSIILNIVRLIHGCLDRYAREYIY